MTLPTSFANLVFEPTGLLRALRVRRARTAGQFIFLRLQLKLACVTSFGRASSYGCLGVSLDTSPPISASKPCWAPQR